MTSTIDAPSTLTRVWDEPAGCSSPRGWLKTGADCVGFYLDYGPDHYRSPHSSIERVMNRDQVVTWCQPDRPCRDCQPGNILGVRYPGGARDHDGPRTSRYCETVSQARAFVETGR